MKLIKVLLRIPPQHPFTYTSAESLVPPAEEAVYLQHLRSRTPDSYSLTQILLATSVGKKGGEAKVHDCEFSHGNTTLSTWELWNAELVESRGRDIDRQTQGRRQHSQGTESKCAVLSELSSA